MEQGSRLAKNTLMLYCRMLILMLIGLYTSRVILNALGVEDYGIYNVVGGIVSMFSILSGSLSAAISRYITFELGKGDISKLKKIFATSVNVQLILGVIVFILIESIGVWFLNNKMVIPLDRIVAANWLLQFSIITFVVNLLSVPYNASIIAHERMSTFAYIGLIEAFFKLLISFLILKNPFDRLVFYGFLVLLVGIIIQFIYLQYCKHNFEECRYSYVFDIKLLKNIFSFAGWNFIGSSSAVLRDHGSNILINIFCGPNVNAARGIAYQVNGVVIQFVNNFMVAINPQITKSYAIGNYKYMMSLIFKGSRFSFYLLIFLSLPIILNVHYILNLWLGTVPDYTSEFVQLVLLFAMSESISNPLITSMLATGKIRDYQILVGGIQMLNFPISYILLKFGALPNVVFIVAIILSQICLIARLYMLRKLIRLPVWNFINKVYINIILVAFFASIIPYIISRIMTQSFVSFIVTSIISLICTLLSIWYIGLQHDERDFLLLRIKMTIKSFV